MKVVKKEVDQKTPIEIFIGVTRMTNDPSEMYRQDDDGDDYDRSLEELYSQEIENYEAMRGLCE